MRQPLAHSSASKNLGTVGTRFKFILFLIDVLSTIFCVLELSIFLAITMDKGTQMPSVSATPVAEKGADSSAGSSVSSCATTAASSKTTAASSSTTAASFKTEGSKSTPEVFRHEQVKEIQNVFLSIFV